MHTNSELMAHEATATEVSSCDCWIGKARKLLGHNMDGDLDEYGYVLDVTYESFWEGLSAQAYAARVIAEREPNHSYSPEAIAACAAESTNGTLCCRLLG